MTEAGGLRHADTVRLARAARHADVRRVVEALRAARDEVLTLWLDAVAAQPFHLGRRERAVADHIPLVYDRLVQLLEAGAATEAVGGIPAQDATYLHHAREHARTRAAQGISAADVALEFRLLRHQIWAALREHIPDQESAADLVGGELLINDALDGAIGVALGFYQEALEETLDDFVTVAAHDLGNPLTGIKGTVQLLLRRASAQRLTPEALASGLHTLAAQAEAMERLLRNMLDAARVRAGHLQLQRLPVDLAELVAESIALQGEEARRRVDLRAEGGPVAGRWDADRIRQVVDNLLSNALKYAPSGPIRVTLTSEADRAVLAISDQGLGLSAEDRANLFQRYFRSPQVVERRLEGSGLGLYICRGIVEAHGGTISADSDGPGLGTTMTVRLPLAARDEMRG